MFFRLTWVTNNLLLGKSQEFDWPLHPSIHIPPPLCTTSLISIKKYVQYWKESGCIKNWEISALCFSGDQVWAVFDVSTLKWNKIYFTNGARFIASFTTTTVSIQSDQQSVCAVTDTRVTTDTWNWWWSGEFAAPLKQLAVTWLVHRFQLLSDQDAQCVFVCVCFHC